MMTHQTVRSDLPSSRVYDELSLWLRTWVFFRFLLLLARVQRKPRLSLIEWLQAEQVHQQRCFLCHPGNEQEDADLCTWHYLLVELRLYWFQLRTNQLGRWKS